MDNPLILVRDDAGALRDHEGQLYNERGQRLDGDGNIIVPPAVVNVGNAVVNRARTIGEYNRPDQFYANRAAIRVPAFQRNDFELKPAYFTLMGQHLFHGLPHEHPMDHIERFEDLVTSIKYNGVSYDFIFCKLFPYSLGGDAAYWLKQLPPGSLSTWEETKNAFLNNFYDDARSEELRNKISLFSQGATEAFKAAWVRFRSYQRDCPHHGFTQVQLLGIFFRGIDWRYQMALDAASNGNLNTRYPEDAYVLIENLASSNSTENADFERKKQNENIDGSQIAEVHAKLNSVHNLLMGKQQKAVHFADKVEIVDEVEANDVNYIGGTGFQNQQYQFNNNQGFTNNAQRGGFKSNFRANSFAQIPMQSNAYESSSYQTLPPKTQESKVESMLEQILEGQQKMTVDFNGKMDAMYTDLDGKIEALRIHQKTLETQYTQTSAAVKGKMVHAHNEHVNAITTGGDFEPDTSVSTDIDAVSTNTDAVSTDTDAVSTDTDAVSTDTDAVSTDTDQMSTDTTQYRSIPVQMLSRDTSKTPVSTDTTSSIDRYPLQTELKILKTPRIVEECVYKPKVPYPLPPIHLRNPITAEKLLALEKMVRKVPNNISFEEAVESRPLLGYFRGCRETEEEIKALFIKARSTPPPMKQLTKKEDPGKFSVPCSISGVDFKESLVDSGSSVNVMSRAVAERLGAAIRSPKTPLTFANSSTSLPYGTIPDLLVKVGDCLVPTDFQVMEMSAMSSTPLILGRPFMATVGAVINTPSKRISFSYIDKKVSYKAIPTGGAPTHVSCITVVTGETLVIDLLDEPIDEPSVIDLLDGPSIITKKDIKTAKAKKKVKNKRIESATHVTLTPQKCDGDMIEYKVKCKGTSKPFSKVRVILPSELKEKGKDVVEGMLSRTLKLEMSGCGDYFGVSSQPDPD